MKKFLEIIFMILLVYINANFCYLTGLNEKKIHRNVDIKSK
jgi:hypothetical protein